MDGCVVKTAGVDESIWTFAGPAVVFESQEDAVEAHPRQQVKAGDVVVIRYEGPRGGPGMQEMLYPTSFLKGRGSGKVCALITDGRFSGGTSGLSIGHASPEAAAGGTIALVEDGDRSPSTSPPVRSSWRSPTTSWTAAAELLEATGGYRPRDRERAVSAALRAYAALALSADKGAVRHVPLGAAPVAVAAGSRTGNPGGVRRLLEAASLGGGCTTTTAERLAEELTRGRHEASESGRHGWAAAPVSAGVCPVASLKSWLR